MPWSRETPCILFPWLLDAGQSSHCVVPQIFWHMTPCRWASWSRCHERSPCSQLYPKTKSLRPTVTPLKVLAKRHSITSHTSIFSIFNANITNPDPGIRFMAKPAQLITNLWHSSHCRQQSLFLNSWNGFVHIQNKKPNMSVSVTPYKVNTLCVQTGFPLTSSNQNSVSIVTECLTGLLFHFYKQWPQ